MEHCPPRSLCPGGAVDRWDDVATISGPMCRYLDSMRSSHLLQLAKSLDESVFVVRLDREQSCPLHRRPKVASEQSSMSPRCSSRTTRPTLPPTLRDTHPSSPRAFRAVAHPELRCWRPCLLQAGSAGRGTGRPWQPIRDPGPPRRARGPPRWSRSRGRRAIATIVGFTPSIAFATVATSPMIA